MEWVETTGRSVQEAKEAALDELGVDEEDAEFEVLAEAQLGLFGRLRSEARVRARVRPTAPRAKEDRRDRRERRRRSGSSAASTESGSAAEGAPGAPAAAAAETAAAGGADTPGPAATAPGEPTAGTEHEETPGRATALAEAGSEGSGAGHSAASAPAAGSGPRRRNRSRRRGGSRPTGGGPSEARLADLEQAGDATDEDETGKGPHVEVALEEQAEVATDFLTKLVTEFGLDATVTVAHPDDDTVELQLSGSDLGILIGPKGATLLAIQSLTRTVVFNETGANNGHINVDVGGYRQKRTEALVRFATQVADRVKETGARTVLEPMSSIDRKVVHDTIAGIDGVSTVSEGEEPRRRVVVLPG